MEKINQHGLQHVLTVLIQDVRLKSKVEEQALSVPVRVIIHKLQIILLKCDFGKP